VHLVWKDILDMTATHNATRTLVTQVNDQNSTSPRRPFFALLNDQSVTTDRQPRAADGNAIFLAGSTLITEPGRLLFHDDLTMTIGRLPWPIAVLQRLERSRPRSAVSRRPHRARANMVRPSASQTTCC
jgi:hypothetical protein